MLKTCIAKLTIIKGYHVLLTWITNNNPTDPLQQHLSYF